MSKEDVIKTFNTSMNELSKNYWNPMLWISTLHAFYHVPFCTSNKFFGCMSLFVFMGMMLCTLYWLYYRPYIIAQQKLELERRAFEFKNHQDMERHKIESGWWMW